MLYFEDLVREYDNGRYRGALRGEGLLTLSSDPPGAQVLLYRYREVGHRLSPVQPRLLGTTPLRDVPIPRGSHLLEISLPGLRETRLPVHISRQDILDLSVRLLGDDELVHDSVYIPSGPFLAGGDPRAPGAFDPQILSVGEILISRYPVTVRQYLEFLNAIAQVDPEEARRRAPRHEHLQGIYWIMGADGQISLPEKDGSGEAWDPRWPIFGISWEDADAYCRWRSSIEGREVRLPLESEWEKAARGVDGRTYPWGERFDPTFCKMRESRARAAYLEPVGTFDMDESPYGVRDTAGCIAEWCQEWFSRRQGLRVVRGGSWNATRHMCRSAGRFGEHYLGTFPQVGFRVVRTWRRMLE
jgi:serine/threonine-protein kinase